VTRLRQIVADITVATANASQQTPSSLQCSDNVASRSCEYDNVLSMSTASTRKIDASDAELSASGRFVSNTSVTLSPPAVLGAPPRTRTTMREMQDRDDYLSFTSPKDVSICPPAAAVRQRPRTPAADIEKEWKQIVYAAETVVEGSPSVDEFSDTSSFEHLPACTDSVDSDHQPIVVSASRSAKSNDLSLSQPLSFANPLFVYKTSAAGSSGGSTSSLDNSVVQKSYSLTSVVGANETRSSSTAGYRRPTTAAERSNSPRHAFYSRQRVGAGGQGWKPSQSNECLTGDLVREQPPMRHSAVLSASGPTARPLGVNSGRSRSTDLSLSCDTDHVKRSGAVSNVVGLDTPPESPHCVSAVHTGRKVTPSQNNVRMGVRSMHRRPVEPEKSKIEARPWIYIFYSWMRHWV